MFPLGYFPRDLQHLHQNILSTSLSKTTAADFAKQANEIF